MSTSFKTLKQAVSEIKKSGKVASQDVVAMRRLVFGDMVVSESEAEELFALSSEAFDNNDWSMFFIEAMSDYLVNQAKPRGYVSEENAQWLIRQIRAAGEMPNTLQLEALIAIVNKAKTCPETLSVFTLELVKESVLKGEGVLRCGSRLQPGVIGAAEVDLLRLVLYGTGSESGVAISRAEAEMLFELNDIVGNEANHPSWPDLFVKAVANFLMASSGYTAPSRQDALRSEEWLDDDRASITDFLSKTFAGGLRGILKSYSVDETWKKRNEKRQQDIAKSEVIDAGEAQWLIDRVNQDGLVHENERKLLRFIKNNSRDINPSLKELLSQVA